MLSLLLTLFISLFSVGSSNHQLEDHMENDIVINDDKPINNVLNYNNTLYLFNSSSDILSVFDYAFDTYDLSNFSQGQSVTFPNSYDTRVPFTTYSNFNVNDWTSSNFSFYLSYFKLTYNYPYQITGDDGINYYVFVVTIQLINDNDEPFSTYVLDYFPSMNSSGQYVYNGYSINYNTSSILRGWFLIDISSNSTLYDVFTYSNHNVTYQIGYDAGFNASSTNSFNNGYQQGYSQGYSDGTDVDATASTIFTGVLDVALIPVNVFLTIFNFEVFGINIGGIVSGLLTLSVVIIILRFLFGGKKDD